MTAIPNVTSAPRRFQGKIADFDASKWLRSLTSAPVPVKDVSTPNRTYSHHVLVLV